MLSDRFKRAARAAFRAGRRTVDLEGETYSLRTHETGRVTYLVLTGQGGHPVANFPLSQDQFEREAERRREEIVRQPDKKKGRR